MALRLQKPCTVRLTGQRSQIGKETSCVPFYLPEPSSSQKTVFVCNPNCLQNLARPKVFVNAW
jgi:hypothetical protein